MVFRAHQPRDESEADARARLRRKALAAAEDALDIATASRDAKTIAQAVSVALAAADKTEAVATAHGPTSQDAPPRFIVEISTGDIEPATTVAVRADAEDAGAQADPVPGLVTH